MGFTVTATVSGQVALGRETQLKLSLGGSAVAGPHYTATAPSVTIPSSAKNGADGSTFTPINDNTYCHNSGFFYRGTATDHLDNPFAVRPRAEHVKSIDNDPPPRIRFRVQLSRILQSQLVSLGVGESFPITITAYAGNGAAIARPEKSTFSFLRNQCLTSASKCEIGQPWPSPTLRLLANFPSTSPRLAS